MPGKQGKRARLTQLPQELLNLVAKFTGWRLALALLKPLCRNFLRLRIPTCLADFQSLSESQARSLLETLDPSCLVQVALNLRGPMPADRKKLGLAAKDGLRHLSRFVSLRVLSLQGTNVCAATVPCLQPLSQVQDLTLTSPYITNKSVAQIVGYMPDLTRLWLRGCTKLTGLALRHVAKLDKLTCLRWCQTHGEGIEHLRADLLTRLGIGWHLASQHVAHLMRCVNLHRLVLPMVYDFDVEALMQILPHLSQLGSIKIGSWYKSNMAQIQHDVREFFRLCPSLVQVEARTPHTTVTRDRTVRRWIRVDGNVEFIHHTVN